MTQIGKFNSEVFSALEVDYTLASLFLHQLENLSPWDSSEDKSEAIVQHSCQLFKTDFRDII